MRKIETNIQEQKHFEETKISFEPYDESYEWNIIRCYEDQKNEMWYGMGGSITESSAYNFYLLPSKK